MADARSPDRRPPSSRGPSGPSGRRPGAMFLMAVTAVGVIGAALVEFAVRIVRPGERGLVLRRGRLRIGRERRVPAAVSPQRGGQAGTGAQPRRRSQRQPNVRSRWDC
jgi:hypothetical protein